MSGHFDSTDSYPSLGGERMADPHHPTWLQRAWEALDATYLPDAPKLPLYMLMAPQICAWWGDFPVPQSGRVVAYFLTLAHQDVPRRPWLLKSWL